MTKEKVQVEQTGLKTGLKFEIDEKFKQALRQYFGTKPFIEVMEVVQVLGKKELTQQESNTIINILGSYPYDEVEPYFVMLQSENGFKQVKNEQAE